MTCLDLRKASADSHQEPRPRLSLWSTSGIGGDWYLSQLHVNIGPSRCVQCNVCFAFSFSWPPGEKHKPSISFIWFWSRFSGCDDGSIFIIYICIIMYIYIYCTCYFIVYSHDFPCHKSVPQCLAGWPIHYQNIDLRATGACWPFVKILTWDTPKVMTWMMLGRPGWISVLFGDMVSSLWHQDSVLFPMHFRIFMNLWHGSWVIRIHQVVLQANEAGNVAHQIVLRFRGKRFLRKFNTDTTDMASLCTLSWIIFHWSTGPMCCFSS